MQDLLDKETLREILININEGKFYVMYLKGKFKVFYARKDFIFEQTDLINILYRLNFSKAKSLSDFDTKKILNKIKEVDKISVSGSGFDKAGKVLGTIARQLVKLKEFKRFKLKEGLRRGCDARYRRL